MDEYSSRRAGARPKSVNRVEVEVEVLAFLAGVVTRMIEERARVQNSVTCVELEVEVLAFLAAS